LHHCRSLLCRRRSSSHTWTSLVYCILCMSWCLRPRPYVLIRTCSLWCVLQRSCRSTQHNFPRIINHSLFYIMIANCLAILYSRSKTMNIHTYMYMCVYSTRCAKTKIGQTCRFHEPTSRCACFLPSCRLQVVWIVCASICMHMFMYVCACVCVYMHT